MNNNLSEPQPLACDLTAIPADVREEHIVTAPQLFATAQEVRELTDGYAFRFSNDTGKFMTIAKYIENERLCCPFFNFSLEAESNHGALWLTVTGTGGAKELLKVGLLENLGNRDDLKKLIQTGGDPRLDEIVANTPLPELKNVLIQHTSD